MKWKMARVTKMSLFPENLCVGFIIVLALFSSFSSFANGNETWDRLFLYPGHFTLGITDLPILSEEEKRMVEALESLPFFKQTQLIYKENGQYYFFNPCYFGLFRWDGIQWKEVSGLEITGYNCSPYLFFHDGKVATLTGLGYWQGRSDLFYFEELYPQLFKELIQKRVKVEYKSWSMYRPDKNYLSMIFIINGTDREIKLKYYEKLWFTWHKFIFDIIDEISK
jgi:hypothetical protein